MRESVRGDVPDTAGDKAFLADGALSETEIAALDRAQSVFGMEKFYNAWELDALTPNEVHAVLYMLTFYDPYTTVHDVTADPDDPNAEGAELTRTLDDFGVYPGMCLYCKQTVEQPIAEFDEPVDATFKIIHRMTLQHLAHHAKVQADALSPCDLRDFTEEELVALGLVEFPHIFSYPINHPQTHPYFTFTLTSSFTASVRLTDDLLRFEKDFTRGQSPGSVRTAKVLIESGEVLSPFTHGIRAAGGPPSARGLEPCIEAVKRIVDWDTKRYDHYLYQGQELRPYFDVVFPAARSLYDEDGFKYENKYTHPTWAWFLVDQSGGQDKSIRLMNQFRALNLPAIRQSQGVRFDTTAAERKSGNGVLLSTWDLYLHRNIGFSAIDYQAGLDARIRLQPLPEHCGLKRLPPHKSRKLRYYEENAAILREVIPGLHRYAYWGEEYSMSFWNRRGENGKWVWHVMLEYACD